jgi:UDP-N-acetylmuramoyl-L-alanyl-D-glutamate--2,6-diaminopimelate ligase
VRLKDLITNISYRSVKGSSDIEITGLAYDSRKVEAGDLFFCIRGFAADGHTFAGNAEMAGAVALIVEEPIDNISLPQVIVEDCRIAMAQLASAYFDFPTAKLKLVGITGTNGKTTTAFMIDAILHTAGIKTGLLGTVEYRIGDETVPVDRTTPESLDMQMLFKKMVDTGVEAAVIEVSSHAIDLSRVAACDFDALVFTNLSQDHLDYHNTIGEYFDVKKKIFDATLQCKTTHIINIDDPYGRKLVRPDRSGQMRYSTKDEAELNAANIELFADGSFFTLNAPAGASEIRIQMPGSYNIYNALGAAGAALALGIDLPVIKGGLEGLTCVPGRFERIDCGQDFSVIVDYAHTPDSLEKVLTAARQLTQGRLITVFGCGGDRDRGKRPLMGKAAVTISDDVVITSDNPRSEAPMGIIEEIVEGVRELKTNNYTIEEDRKQAIERALQGARKGDFVVIAGKGHEQGQEIAGNKIPFDDAKIAREYLKGMVL